MHYTFIKLPSSINCITLFALPSFFSRRRSSVLNLRQVDLGRSIARLVFLTFDNCSCTHTRTSVNIERTNQRPIRLNLFVSSYSVSACFNVVRLFRRSFLSLEPSFALLVNDHPLALPLVCSTFADNSHTLTHYRLLILCELPSCLCFIPGKLLSSTLVAVKNRKQNEKILKIELT